MMPTTLTADSDQKTDQRYQKVYDWLHAQAELLGLQVTLQADEATLRHGWLYLPVYIEGASDAYDNAIKLQKLEDTWNDRVPQPEPPLFLVPAKDPIRRAAWDRVAGALQRKINAIDAFSAAANKEEQEKAVAEFREAEQAEKNVHQAYEQIMPMNERVE
jgi:hypothetical protein